MLRNEKLNYKFLIPAILGTLFIIYMSSRPGQQYLWVAPATERVISNLAHIPVYAVVTFFWLRSFTEAHRLATYLIIFGGLIFSISDEFLQSFIPGRTASIADIGLDLIGILIGIVALNLSRTYAARPRTATSRSSGVPVTRSSEPSCARSPTDRNAPDAS